MTPAVVGRDDGKGSSRVWRWAKRVAVSAVLLTAACVAWNRHHYPYGWSHCCDKFLSLELSRYASEHDGWFPRGEVTPEASLSLLYRQDKDSVNVLRGKTVPESVVRERLESGQLLTPETWGWHYVDGLRQTDDPELALFWDKVGLGHNGERLSNGGHIVWFVSGNSRFVSESEWEQFLIDQERRRSAARR